MKALLSTFLLCIAVAAQTRATGTSIVHVTVIDVDTGAELTDQTVRIEGNRITSIASTNPGDTTQPGAVDAHGAFLIPGLWDMHVHLTRDLSVYIANGVTGVRIMAGDRDTPTLRAELAKQSPVPEIYLASAIVDGSPPVWPGSWVVKNLDDARRTVDEIKVGGADFIKVYNRIPRDAYFALADEAKKQHIDFEGHVPDTITAQEASAGGQRSMEHLQGIAFACSKDQKMLMGELDRARFFRDRFVLEANAYHTIDQAKCHDLFLEFRQNETWQVPTLTVRQIWGRLDDSKFTGDHRLAYVEKQVRERWTERTAPQQRIWNRQMYEMARGIFSVEESVVGAMYKTGVPLMAGTDAGNPYCFPGFSLHNELALLVQSGLTPLAALRTATLNPAKFLGRTAELGTIEPGKLANLVLLRADPLADIHNTTQIDGVWLEGRYFDKAELTQMLDSIKQNAKH